MSTSLLNGLTIQAVAPAAFPCKMVSPEDSVLSTKIGVLRYSAIFRTSATISSPFMTGMLTSTMITSTRCRCAASTPSRPFLASTTSNPAPSSKARACCRTVAASSTTRTVCTTLVPRKMGISVGVGPAQLIDPSVH